MTFLRGTGLFLLILVLCGAWFSLALATEQSQPSVLDNLKFVPGDEDGNEKKAIKAELLVSATEEKAIAQIQKLIRKYKGTPLEADLQFRLAEMYMRRSRSDRFFEVHHEGDTVKLAPRLVKRASSRRSLTQAVEVYQYIQKKFPAFAQMDLVVFNHAFARQALGQDKEAESLYWVLVKDFTDSPLVPDAHLAIGEIAFQKAEFSKALERFNAIRAFPNSRVYPYGLYKAAWTHYNLRDTAAGLKNLEEVVAFGNHVAQEHLDAKLDLRKEAIGDMTLFYEDVYLAKDAYSYFHKQAGEADMGPALVKLADLYERHARYQDERTVLLQLVQERPTSTTVPDAMNRIVMAADSMKQKDVAVADLESFTKRCDMRSDFVKAHPDLLQACQDSVQKTALLLAEKWLKIWNKNPYDVTFADSSEKAFAIYLRYKKTDDEYVKAHFLYAELLFKREKYRQASQEYASVGADSKSEIGHDASYAACLSLEKAVGDKWSDKDEKTFHDLATTYVTQYPKGKYRLEVEFKMAFLAYEKNRYDEAAPIFLRLGQSYPRDEKGQKAQDLYLDILNIKKDFAGIRKYAGELIKKSPQERISKLNKIYEQAYFLEVQNHEEKGNLAVALQGYRQFVKENPASELAEKAYWNMMQLQYKTGDGFGGAQASIEFAQRFPKSEQATAALAHAAQMLEQMAQLQRAADVLIQLAERETASAAKWRELAADFYALSGQYPNARKLYQNLISSSAKEEEKNRLLAKLELFERNYGSAAAHDQIVKQMVQKDIAPLGNQSRIAQLQKIYDSGDYQAAFQEAKSCLAIPPLRRRKKRRFDLLKHWCWKTNLSNKV